MILQPQIWKRAEDDEGEFWSGLHQVGSAATFGIEVGQIKTLQQRSRRCFECLQRSDLRQRNSWQIRAQWSGLSMTEQGARSPFTCALILEHQASLEHQSKTAKNLDRAINTILGEADGEIANQRGVAAWLKERVLLNLAGVFRVMCQYFFEAFEHASLSLQMGILIKDQSAVLEG